MKKFTRLTLLLLTAIFIPITVNAKTIKGYVYDKKTNEPIIGAIVTVMGQNIGTQTDFDGCFVIKDVNNGTDKLVIKSLGHKEHTQTIILSEDSTNYDLGKIYLKPAKSKHYNRIMVSFNPANIPTIEDSEPYIDYLATRTGATGFSGSFLHGYNFYNNFAIEAGVKYNYTFHSWEDYDKHSKSKSHYIAIFTNLAYNLPIRNVTISPYIGLYMRKFLYSKMSYGNSNGCETFNTARWFNSPWLNPGVQFGIGYKYKQIYLGLDASIDLPEPQYRYYLYLNDFDNPIYGEFSATIGYEF